MIDRFHIQKLAIDAVHQIKDQVPDSAEIRSIVEFLNATELGIIGKM